MTGRIARRGFFREGLLRAAAAAADALEGLGREVARRSGSASERRRPLPHRSRPPGAVDEPLFLELCTGCNDCVATCPAWAIRVAGEGEPHPGYPVIEPNASPCAICDDPLPCVAACQTGALVPTPRTSIALGLAFVKTERCVVPSGRSCDLCLAHCPIPERALAMTSLGPKVQPGCTGCGLCVPICPEAAIEVVPRPF